MGMIIMQIKRAVRATCRNAILASALLLALNVPAAALNLNGVLIPDTLKTDEETLVLNGAGYRVKLLSRLYIAALYLPAAYTRPDTVYAVPSARVMRMHILRVITLDRIIRAWEYGLKANLTEAEHEAIRDRATRFSTMQRALQPGDIVRLELLGDGRTRMFINTEFRGEISGRDFQTGLLKVWLGEYPADPKLKRALLGGTR